MAAKLHRRIVGRNWVRNGFGGTASFGLLSAAENTNNLTSTFAHKIVTFKFIVSHSCARL